MAYNTAVFDNMIYAQLGDGTEGGTIELKSSGTGKYNDLTDSNRYPWYVNGESIYSYSHYINIFKCSYYDGLMVNGLAIVRFYGYSNNGEVVCLDNSSITVQPNSLIGKTYSDIVIPLTSYQILESPNIRGITLATMNGDDVFYQYTLRVYVIPGTQHEYF